MLLHQLAATLGGVGSRVHAFQERLALLEMQALLGGIAGCLLLIRRVLPSQCQFCMQFTHRFETEETLNLRFSKNGMSVS
jgi:hypothetical protein